MRKFTEGGWFELPMRSLAYRLFAARGLWHNRIFTATQAIERQPTGGYLVRWPKYGKLQARSIAELPVYGNKAGILASGPSIACLTDLKRLFNIPTACVNGSISAAERAGVRVPYYFVSDYTFILQNPDRFISGAQRADAVILTPMTLFAAMALAPDGLSGSKLYLRDDLRLPFKKQRPKRDDLIVDPAVLVHPTRDIFFSLEPVRGTFPAATVVYDAIQVLFGIGYEQLYMFGVDLNSSGRFYHERKPSPSRLHASYENSILPAFELVRDYCQRFDRKLTNCSVSSRLPSEIIPKADGNKVISNFKISLAA